MNDPRKFKAPYNPNERIWQEADRLRAAHPAGRELPVKVLDLAEAALLNCAVLLTSDAHLRGLDFTRLAFELQACDAVAPIIATPREIVHTAKAAG